MNYIIAGLIGVLFVFAFAIGIDKMMRIILGNYLLTIICVALWSTIDTISFAIKPLVSQIAFLGVTFGQLDFFLTNSKLTIIILTYLVLMVLIFSKSKIYISLPSDENTRIFLKIIIIPLTVISAILTAQTAILWPTIFNTNSLLILAAQFQNSPLLFYSIARAPLRIFLHGIITVLITSEIKFSKPDSLENI